MCSRPSALFLSLFPLLLVLQAHANNPHLENVLEQQLENFQGLWNVEDVPRMMKYFSPNASILLPGSPALTGNLSIARYLTNLVNTAR